MFELIKRTATLGESNSILVVGPRGSGKTMVRTMEYSIAIQMQKGNWNLRLLYMYYTSRSIHF